MIMGKVQGNFLLDHFAIYAATAPFLALKDSRYFFRLGLSS